ncbi:hypothetical protein COV93_00135 [Candidatus Woesearchaeota archaeon CG11_big_fil_rev_8_21_14_0_20_43_8]|nr:MAG: hypothetical protein COV93_00135 [Candidatus Woesearchaeota archaeon CG11_big_fil_rev_8_21_14_0_20_43_8]PIO05249.1 MAG: hypothetical protein COT47_05550 [Candidatus Woesearchaeota archaeon CG08_land_8_20_14_0_20_43_7]
MAEKKVVKRPMVGHHEIGPSGKKLLHRHEEFDIMKMVLDKFLWLGVLVIGYGLFKFYESIVDSTMRSVTIFVTGGIMLVLFAILLKKEYEIVG